jgi:phage-related protein
MYHLADDAVVVMDVFAKKTATTPKAVLDACRQRLALYRKAAKGTRDAR